MARNTVTFVGKKSKIGAGASGIRTHELVREGGLSSTPLTTWLSLPSQLRSKSPCVYNHNGHSVLLLYESFASIFNSRARPALSKLLFLLYPQLDPCKVTQF